MPRLAHALCAAAVLVAVGGCAHTAPRRTPLPAVAWPAPPAAARAVLAEIFPDPAAPAPPRSIWRRLADAVAGIDRQRERASWLARPFGVAASADGTYYVADPDGPAVLRVRAGGDAARLGCRGLDWIAPMAVAIAGDGALWVADGGAARVVRVAPDGTCRALGAGALERPTGVAVDGDRIWVADPARHVVLALSASTGAELARVGGLGSGDGQLHFPTAVAVGLAGEALVVDALNFRVARFARDGAWLGAFGEAGGRGGAFERPKGIAVDERGRIYVSDAQRDAVLVYAADGRFDVALGRGGVAEGELTMPSGVAVAAGRLLVADSLNRRVQVFQLTGESP